MVALNPADSHANNVVSGPFNNICEKTGAEGTSGRTDGDATWNSTSGGKFYFEYRQLVSAANARVGVGRSDQSTTQFCGAASTTLGYRENGDIHKNNAVSNTIMAYGDNDWIGVAVDITNAKIWFKNITDASGWNNDVIGNQNPENNTGGIALVGIHAANAYTFQWSGTNVNDKGEFNFGDTAFQQAVPAGFTRLNSLVAVGKPNAGVVSPGGLSAHSPVQGA